MKFCVWQTQLKIPRLGSFNGREKKSSAKKQRIVDQFSGDFTSHFSPEDPAAQSHE